MHERFRYIFESLPGSSYPPIAISHGIITGRVFSIDGPGGRIEVLPITVAHGEINALALKIGKMMYLPDVSAIPGEAETHFHGLDLWIIDALRHRPHPSHFSLSEALAWIERTKPRQAVLTNLHTDLDYAALLAMVPTGVSVAYDGMTVTLDRGMVSLSG
jgi:phosphoribosyl 1,2-cyclic phosphate phosphodiesterase